MAHHISLVFCDLALKVFRIYNRKMLKLKPNTKHHDTSWLIAKLPVHQLQTIITAICTAEKNRVQISLIQHRLHQQSKDAHCSRSFWACKLWGCSDAAVRTYFHQVYMMLSNIVHNGVTDNRYMWICMFPEVCDSLWCHIEVWRYTDFDFDNVSSAKASYQFHKIMSNNLSLLNRFRAV